MIYQTTILLWFTYCSYYLCRANYSAIQPLLMTDKGWNAAQVGLISSAMLGFYALGQLIHGHLADRYGPIRVIFVGMLASALANILMGFSSTLIMMIALWSINGFFQATGWPSSIKILGEYLPNKKRSLMMGWWGSCYQAGTVLSWLLTGFLVMRYGWRIGFYVPAAVVAIASIVFLKGMQKISNSGIGPDGSSDKRQLSISQYYRSILCSSYIRKLAIAYGCLGYIRYGFINWGILMLMQKYSFALDASAIKMSVLPLAGTAGAVLAGWFSQRVFQGRSYQVATFSFMALFLALLLLYWIEPGSGGALLVLIGGIGLFINSADLIIGGSAAQEMASAGLIGSTAGFIDAMMYVGAISSGFLTGLVIDRFGWKGAILSWLVAAIVGAVTLSQLWIEKYVKLPKRS